MTNLGLSTVDGFIVVFQSNETAEPALRTPHVIRARRYAHFSSLSAAEGSVGKDSNYSVGADSVHTLGRFMSRNRRGLL